MSKQVTIRQFRYFAAAARTGRFSMAAAEEHVSQSAITSAVLSLEAHLKVPLFDRLQHGVALTAAGHDFYRHVRFVLDAFDEALHQPGRQNDGVSGVLRVAASYTVLGYFLPELVLRFKKANPGVQFDLVDMELAQMEQAVLNGDIDMAVGLTSNLKDIGHFEHQVLLRSARKLWVSPSHPLGMRASVTLQEIAPYPYILILVDNAEESGLRFWRQHRLEPNVVLKTRSMEAVRGFVAQGLGVTILSEMVYRPWSLEGKKINAVPIEGGVPVMEVGMFWHKSVPLCETAQAFKHFLVYACH